MWCRVLPSRSIIAVRNLTTTTKSSSSSSSSYSFSPKSSSFSRWLLRFSAVSMVGVTGATLYWRYYHAGLSRQQNFQAKVHKDASIARVNVYRELEPRYTMIITKGPDGQHTVVVENETLSEFLQQHLRRLREEKERMIAAAKAQLEASLDDIFDVVRSRIPVYADWYFSYPTNYKLLSKASKSALRNAVSLSRTGMSLSEAVTADVTEYLQKQYELILLKPENTDPKIQRAYLSSIQHAHRDFVSVSDTLDSDMRRFIAEKTTHLERQLNNTDVILCMDWSAQLNKLNSVVVSRDKGSVEGAALGAALILGGASLGKSVAAAATTATAKLGSTVLASKATTSTAATTLSKLAAPFVSKAAAASASIGAWLVGPFGFLLGAAAGIGVDMTVNAGVQLMQQEAFQRELLEAIEATQSEWRDLLTDELDRVINVWFEDSMQALIDQKAKWDK